MIRTLSALALAAAVVLAPGAVIAAPVQAPGCDVESATLDWGFKESFRGYLDGSIANGEWTVADGATYETPSFGFATEDGRLDPRDPNGQIDFPGSVRFTGHGGLLDTTIANPVILFRGQEPALLLLDVSGPTMEGGEVAVTATPFVTVDLSAQVLAPVDGVITIWQAPTTLTADGEAAFPNYPAGEEFDPISMTIDVGDCDLEGLPIGTDVIEGEGSGVIGDATPWVVLVVVLGSILLVLVAILVIGKLRR